MFNHNSNLQFCMSLPFLVVVKYFADVIFTDCVISLCYNYNLQNRILLLYCFNQSISSNKCSVYINHKYDIISHSENVKDLGITMGPFHVKSPNG